jgi:DNA-binding XRE family transcriptional regulator
MSNRIKSYREYYGISQRELASKAGISHAEMNFIEVEKRIPNVFIAQRIARVLKVSTDKLFVEDIKEEN